MAAPRRKAPKKPVINLTEDDIRPIRPQFNAAYATLVGWRLGGSLEELAWLITFRIIAVTSGQLKEMGVYERLEEKRGYGAIVDPFGQL